MPTASPGTQPDKSGVAKTATQKPEFVRINEAVRLFSVGRSTLYQWISDGSIRSVSVRRRGNIRGIRLLAVDSLEKFVNSFDEEKPATTRKK